MHKMEFSTKPKKWIEKLAKEIVFDVQGVDIANRELETLEKHEMLKKCKLQQKTKASQSWKLNESGWITTIPCAQFKKN